MKIDLNELAAVIHHENEKWWQDPATGNPIKRSKDELLMLIITEISEAVEGIRKDLMDDHLTHRKMEEVEMADAFIRLCDFAGGFEYEFKSTEQFCDANAWMANRAKVGKTEYLFLICGDVARVGYQIHMEAAGEARKISVEHYLGFLASEILNYCERFGLDILAAQEEKRMYNQLREDHKHEVRLKAHGNKF